MFELDLESQRVVEATALLLKLVLEIANIRTVSVPSVTGAAVLRVLFFLRVEKWFHTLVIRALGFNQVDNIKFVVCELLYVLDSEVEPLGKSSCHMIVLKYQIVFVVSDLDGSSQVS